MNGARILQKLGAMHRELDALEAEIRESMAPDSKKIPPKMRIEQYAKHRSASVRTVYRWMKLGMPVERRGKVVRIVVAEADAWDEETAIARQAEINAGADKEG